MAHPLVLHGRPQATTSQHPIRSPQHGAEASQSRAHPPRSFEYQTSSPYASPSSTPSAQFGRSAYRPLPVEPFQRLSLDDDRVRYQLRDGGGETSSNWRHDGQVSNGSSYSHYQDRDGYMPHRGGGDNGPGSAGPILQSHNTALKARPVSIEPPTPVLQRPDRTSSHLDQNLPRTYPAPATASYRDPSRSQLAMSDPSMYRLPSSASNSTASSAPALIAWTPSVEYLSSKVHILDSKPERDRLAFAQDVIRDLDRHLFPSGSQADFLAPETAPTMKTLPAPLEDLLNVAIPIIISFTEHELSPISSLATYLRGKLLASGACPDFLPRDQRQAFRDFEVAARSGEPRGWFRLGRDYEGVGDLGRARECFEKGRIKGDCESTYRMAMANLLGQLHLSPDPGTALPLLRQASESTNVDCPQPSYVYGMLLAGELSTPFPLPPSLVLPTSSSPSDALLNQHTLAREAIERAAYFGLAPAQYKAGYLYEHAALGAPYDPLISVQWYSIASQGQEIEADMALSKWFLCGAEGHFGKDEKLARTFAEKAARKGHPNGCFAMGYYYELGIGGRQDRDQAKKWYQRAAKLDNADAIQRLAALSAPTPQTMTLNEHQSRLNATLVRRHTQAKIRSDRLSTRRPGPPRESSRQAKSDLARIDAVARAAAEAPPHMPVPVPMPAAPYVQAGQNMPSSQSFSNGSYPRSPQPRTPGLGQPSFPPSPSAGRIDTRSAPRPIRPHIDIPSSPSQNRIRTSPSMPISIPPSNSAGGLMSNSSPGRPVQRGYILQDSLVPTLPPPETLAGDPGPRKKGPQTFAEMGFVSKPVQDEGCTIM